MFLDQMIGIKKKLGLPEQLNEKDINMKAILKIILISVIIFTSGCAQRFVYVRDEKPIIPLPDRPKIAKISDQDLQPLTPLVKDAIIKTVDDLKIYSTLLEQNITTYNAWAEENNKKNDINFNINNAEPQK